MDELPAAILARAARRLAGALIVPLTRAFLATPRPAPPGRRARATPGPCSWGKERAIGIATEDVEAAAVDDADLAAEGAAADGSGAAAAPEQDVEHAAAG